jgi:hypothetical protein
VILRLREFVRAIGTYPPDSTDYLQPTVSTYYAKPNHDIALDWRSNIPDGASHICRHRPGRSAIESQIQIDMHNLGHIFDSPYINNVARANLEGNMYISAESLDCVMASTLPLVSTLHKVKSDRR